MVERDAGRRRRVAELLDAGAARVGEDFHHAAMVFQHGDRLDGHWRAHRLALRSAELGYRLAAAAHDRLLVHQGRPQKYGAQYRGEDDRWVLYEVDPATTDAERAEWDVPPLAEARRRAERMTAERPPRRSAWMAGAETPKVFRHGGLELQIVRTAPGHPAPAMPAVEPLHEGDPVPWLPEGLAPRRLGPGFVAVREPDQPVLGWHRGSAPVLIGWQDEDGPAPDPEPLQVGGSPTIVCRGRRGTWVVVVRPDGRSWVVSGHVAADELLRVAASLP